MKAKDQVLASVYLALTLMYLALVIIVRAQLPPSNLQAQAVTQAAIINQFAATWDDGTAVTGVLTLATISPVTKVFSANLFSGKTSYTMPSTFGVNSYSLVLTCDNVPFCPNGTTLFYIPLTTTSGNLCDPNNTAVAGTAAWLNLFSGLASTNLAFVFRKADFSIAKITMGAVANL